MRVEGLTVWCREEDLAASETPKRPKPSAEDDEARRRAAGDGAVRGPLRLRLDLHGLVVDEAIARVDEAINEALLRGADVLDIVHGRGTGRIRDALHRHLASMRVVAAFRLDPRNPGVTIVHL